MHAIESEPHGGPAAPRSLGIIYCLSGCTAVGKTELALRWAEENDAEIVSCDSLLFYRGMDIGTAKPDARERSRVPHHLIDILEPSESMDIGRYVKLAVETVRAIQSRGRKVLVVGGSGFYLKAFFEPVIDAVTVGDDAKAEAANIMAAGLARAVDELERRNPDGLGSLDIQNPRRVSKALERCIQSGKPLCQLRSEFAAQGNELVAAPKRLVILDREKSDLDVRIEKRARQMLEAGLIEEVRTLLQRGIERNPSAYSAIGYRETIAYLKGEYEKAELVHQIAANTRRLAKKQRTWFRGQMPFARHIDASVADPDELDAHFAASLR